jgi:hypothetical protein
VWCKLGSCGSGMLLCVQRCLNIDRHGEVNIFVDIVPLEYYATIKASRRINIDLICFLKGKDEMLGIVMAHKADATIIHHTRRCEVVRDVRPKAWSERYLMATMDGQTSHEEVVGEYAGARDAIHAFLHVRVDVSIQDE